MNITRFEKLENKILVIRSEKVLIDKDLAELYGIETRDVNKAVKNNPDKFPDGYIIELTEEEFTVLRGKFSTTKFSKTRTLPKAFTEKGLYMLATILKSKNALDATFTIIETFAKVKELSRNINNIMQTTDEEMQQQLANKSNKILEEIIDIEADVLEDDEDGEIIETQTTFEFNLGFAKVSKSIKKIKTGQGKTK